jgi:hypothetical protein
VDDLPSALDVGQWFLARAGIGILPVSSVSVYSIDTMEPS